MNSFLSDPLLRHLDFDWLDDGSICIDNGSLDRRTITVGGQIFAIGGRIVATDENVLMDAVYFGHFFPGSLSDYLILVFAPRDPTPGSGLSVIWDGEDFLFRSLGGVMRILARLEVTQ